MPSERSGSSVGISRRRALTVGAAALVPIGASLSPLGSRTTRSDTGQSTPLPENTSESTADPLERLHAADITGTDVDVGILDPTGFDPGHPDITNRIAAVEWFGRNPRVPETINHGTAAAATVARVAPDAELHLAGFDRPDGFKSATEWARRRGVDIIFTPVAAHGVATIEGSTVARAAHTAAESGIVVVAPTGNAARGHWTSPIKLGDISATNRTSHRIHVESLSDTGRLDGRFIAWVSHDGPRQLDLGLALVEQTAQGDGRNLIALSQPVGPERGQRVVATLDNSDYWLELRSQRGIEIDDSTTLRIEVTTPTHQLRPTQPEGSIAIPAAAEPVIAVGAVDETGAGVAPYSGRGPTSTGNTGVDLVAPPRPWIGPNEPGTSAAAARAAGVTALVREHFDGSPARTANLLRMTATDIGKTGDDLATGAGRMDPGLAVQRARARTVDSVDA